MKANPALQNFEMFLSVWNMQQSLHTPTVHRTIAHWLTQNQRRRRQRFLLMAFRGCGKSTLIGLYCAWLLWRDPDCRILVVAADQTLATKMVRMVRKVIEKHPLTAPLRPLKTEQWAADRLTVQRPTVSRDPSILAAGLKGNITGMRADVIICDDVEVPKTCDSADKRDQLRQHLRELEFILTPRGSILYIGTPHTDDSIYADFLAAYHALRIPLLDAHGRSAWPQRFPESRIAQIREQTGPLQFTSQMMLQPMRLSDVRLDPQLLQVYDTALSLREGGGETVLSIGDARMVGCSCWWDPAVGSDTGDKSVIACAYTDSHGHYWLHGLHLLQTDPHDPCDPATQQALQIAVFLRQHHVRHLHVEINGLGQFLPRLLQQVFAAEKLPVTVTPVTSRTNKTQRILQTLDPILAARALHVHTSVLANGLRDEMQDFNPTRKNNRDDCLDAVAGALGAQPVRLPRLIWHSKQPTDWRPQAQAYAAHSDFTL